VFQGKVVFVYLEPNVGNTGNVGGCKEYEYFLIGTVIGPHPFLLFFNNF
jgi:hypothetical protein